MADNGNSGTVDKGDNGVHDQDYHGAGGELESHGQYGDGGVGRKSGKNEDKKVFVGGIGLDTNEEDLKSFFGQFGEVAHVHIKYDHYTGRSRGFAFVEFANGDACQEALRMKDRDIKGRKCEVKPAKSRENKKVFIGGLPAEFSEAELRQQFEQYGTVDEIEWPFDKAQNRRKNFAFIVFEDEEAAARAAANPKQRFGDRMCDVKIAVPQYMRPQKQQQASGGWNAHSASATGAGGWGDFTGYSAYGYGGYGGGYGTNYYEDNRYGNYDYGGYSATAGAYDNWGGYGGSSNVSHTSTGGGGGAHRTNRGGYNSYY